MYSPLKLAGASVNGITGDITWTPDEADGPGNYAIRIRVTDDGTPPLSDEQAFTVHVHEVNIPPALTVPGPITVDEGSPITFTATAMDPDISSNTLAFSLVTTSPAGATIDPATGTFNWLTDDNGDFIVRVSVDDGAGGVTQADIPVTVLNVDPVVTITAPDSGALYCVDVPVMFTGSAGPDATWRCGTASPMRVSGAPRESTSHRSP